LVHRSAIRYRAGTSEVNVDSPEPAPYTRPSRTSEGGQHHLPQRLEPFKPRDHTNACRRNPPDLSRSVPARLARPPAAWLTCFRRLAGLDKVQLRLTVGTEVMAALSRILLLIAALIFGGKAMAADLESTLYMDVPAGRVVIEMRPDLAPATVAQIKALV